MVYVTQLKQSGTKVWARVLPESQGPDAIAELITVAEELSAQIKLDGRGYHIDVSQRERDLLLEHGATPVFKF